MSQLSFRHPTVNGGTSAGASDRSNRRCTARLSGRGVVVTRIGATAEHHGSMHLGARHSFTSASRAPARALPFAGKGGSVAYGCVTYNNAFERTVTQSGVSVPRSALIAWLRQAASWPAAQLDR